eukprot:NODE_432_length_1567_cov_385.400794.p1 GENE.NODE_432_length_1567_cov_385.400794~~NODE_432_length_1567_cov_385.400794.p1  ORF type:complete len:493 (+),score=79.99 NODE_432_length_1567_cov_385.400794:3-1481(+)
MGSLKRMTPTQHPPSYLGRPDVCDADEAMHCSGEEKLPWLSHGGAVYFQGACLAGRHPSGSSHFQRDVAPLVAAARGQGSDGQGNREGICNEAPDNTDPAMATKKCISLHRRQSQALGCRAPSETSWADLAICRDEGPLALASSAHDGRRSDNAPVDFETLKVDPIMRKDNGTRVVASPADESKCNHDTPVSSVALQANVVVCKVDGSRVAASSHGGWRRGTALPRHTPSRSCVALRKGARTPRLRHVGCSKARHTNDKTTNLLHTMKPTAGGVLNAEATCIAQADEPKTVGKGGGEPRDVNGASEGTTRNVSVRVVKEEPAEADVARAQVWSQTTSVGAWLTQGRTRPGHPRANAVAAVLGVAKPKPAVKGEPGSPVSAKPAPRGARGAGETTFETIGHEVNRGDVSAWLRSINGGSLQAQYEKALLLLFDDISQIAALYENRPQDFFEDVGVTDAAHKTAFSNAIDSLCQQHGLAPGTTLSDVTTTGCAG